MLPSRTAAKRFRKRDRARLFGTTLSFAGQTTVKRTGAFVAYALDVPPDSAGTTKDVGKFTGLKSKGTYANLLNSGKFNDTFEG